MTAEKHIFVDYENVQDVKISLINETVKMTILVGEDQTKVPINLVEQTQPFGKSIEWIHVPGKGKNALDFFIAFFIGSMVEKDKEKEYLIYSKDTGFDPLVNYLKPKNISIRRIVSFKELDKNAEQMVNNKYDTHIGKIKENLQKVTSNKRPKTRKGLSGHIKTLLNIKDDEITKIIEEMFIEKLIHEENGKLKYVLE